MNNEQPVGQNQYRCEACRGVFDKEWTDEEAKAEHDRDFPGASLDDACVICDDCYQKVRPANHPEAMAVYQAIRNDLISLWMTELAKEPMKTEDEHDKKE